MDNYLEISKKMFRLKGFKVSDKRIKEVLLKNPDYPNISSLISMFSYYGVESKLGKTSIKSLMLQKDYFYAFLVGEGLVIVSEVDAHTIKFYSPESGWTRISLTSFDKKWSGVILLLDFSNCKLIKKSTLVFDNFNQIIFTFSFVLIILIGLPIQDKIIWFWLILKIVGIFLSLLLIKMRVDSEASLKVCSLNKFTDCRKVLSSRYAP